MCTNQLISVQASRLRHLSAQRELKKSVVIITLIIIIISLLIHRTFEKIFTKCFTDHNKIDPNQKESLQKLVSVLNIYLYVDSVHILGIFCSCSCGFSTVFICCCVYVLCGNMQKRLDYCFYFPFCWQQKTSYENTCLFNKLSKCLMCKFVFQACK